MRAAGELDYYLLFANRRLAGVAEEKIRKRIAQAAEIDEGAVYLCGEEVLDQYLTWEPDILRRACINPFDVQAFIDPRDLACVIQALAEGRGCLSDVSDDDTPPPERRVSLAEKNLIYGLSPGIREPDQGLHQGVWPSSSLSCCAGEQRLSALLRGYGRGSRRAHSGLQARTP